MSNWSKIIICWSGLDKEFENGRTDEATRLLVERVTMIAESCPTPLHRSAISYPCGSDPALWSSACETVVVLEANHFDPDELLCSLKTLHWQLPEEVEFLWKDENADTYTLVRLSESPSTGT